MRDEEKQAWEERQSCISYFEVEINAKVTRNTIQ